MRSRYKVQEPNAAHFVTSTTLEWLPIFTTAACCDILVESLEFCRREKGLRVYGWVIMEHHFHAVVDGPDLSQIMADLKKFPQAVFTDAVMQQKLDYLHANPVRRGMVASPEH